MIQLLKGRNGHFMVANNLDQHGKLDWIQFKKVFLNGVRTGSVPLPTLFLS
jgi:hypothetical protein